MRTQIQSKKPQRLSSKKEECREEWKGEREAIRFGVLVPRKRWPLPWESTNLLGQRFKPSIRTNRRVKLRLGFRWERFSGDSHESPIGRGVKPRKSLIIGQGTKRTGTKPVMGENIGGLEREAGGLKSKGVNLREGSSGRVTTKAHAGYSPGVFGGVWQGECAKLSPRKGPGISDQSLKVCPTERAVV